MWTSRKFLPPWRFPAVVLLLFLLADWQALAVPFPHLKLLEGKPRTRLPVYASNVTVWKCDSAQPAVRELCELTASKQRLSMDYWRAQWTQYNCEARVDGGWLHPWPCYYDMWRHFWQASMSIANWCWGQDTVPWCGITSFAIVLAMLKQGNMWDEAEALFNYGDAIGINSFTKWPSIYQVAWFVPLQPDVSPSIFVPGGIGRLDEPTAPYSYGHGSLDNGFFDIYSAEGVRPVAETLLPHWETITSEWLNSEAREAFGGPDVAFEAGEWSRYVPGKEGFQNWWDMGKAALTSSVRLWGGYPGNDDKWWNWVDGPRVSPTLYRLLKQILPTTARPVPEYVLGTSSRWEHVDIKRILPGANQAMHPDPCRCLWQICLDGCEGAFLQVGKTVLEYKSGKMIAFDATFEHTVWVREENTIARTVLHGVFHYCNGTYAE